MLRKQGSPTKPIIRFESKMSGLRYVVRELVEGRADSIKERTIALEVFGKSIHFDSGSDSLVRVKAREVRKRLAEYYESAPDSPLRIELPLGSYVPIIRAAETFTSAVLPEVKPSVTPAEVLRTVRMEPRPPENLSCLQNGYRNCFVRLPPGGRMATSKRY